MKVDPPLVAASGLRPLGAFVVIGAVVVAVGVRVSALTSIDAADRVTANVLEERFEPPAYEIVDRGGSLLATTLRRIDLVVSPRSAWQAHTPDHMARVLAAACGGVPTADELLDSMIPDARDGVITVSHPDWSLRPRQAVAVGDWILGGTEGSPLRGFAVVPDPERAGCFRLHWNPVEALSREQREFHGETSPIRWTRRIADGLAAALFGDGAVPPSGDVELLQKQRSDVWRALMPRGLCRAIVALPADRAPVVQTVLEREGVRPHQMKLEVRRERFHPSGELQILGDWGYWNDEQVRPEPRSGLELLCARTAQEPWAGWLANEWSGYAFREAIVPRRPVRPYFVGSRAGSDPAVLRTTIDVDLTRRTRELLTDCLEKHGAALAMAIVVDVASGDVLALEAVQAYGFQGHAPSMYQFTPGSTFKAVTMAIALNEGLVHPDEIIDVGYGGAWRLENSSRVIHEAEGHAEGKITASECLSESMNAGLVQIGLRVDSRRFREKLHELGYDRAPALGLGSERSGSVPALARSGRWEGLWPRNWSHASVCFGHEVATTLVQHAAALASIVRGGEWRPLRLIRSVAQGELETLEPLAPGRRVFSQRASNAVRAMMELGAREGTGRRLWRDTFSLATKTGTTEKVLGEVCAHLLGRAVDQHLADGATFGASEQRALRSQRPDDHRTCYTSSVCAVGRTFDSEHDTLTLVVVEEPRRGGKYGSDVAGPTAVAILEEALGLTTGGEAPVDDVVPGFAPLEDGTSATDEERVRPLTWSEIGG